jgi:1,5-anhydro-D-fructose reductase (1,5-anhydro-D-mannitol-forming)
MSTLEDIRTRGHVRWGIIGCGDVTEVKSGPAFRRVKGSSVRACMRRDAAKARDYAERHGIERWTVDAAAIIDADDVDAVYVATPPSSHLEYVRRAAAAGKPVYVEKPMALDRAEGEAMVAACEAAGVPLYVAYYRRAQPRFEFVRARLHDGSIGEPTLVQCELHQPPPAGPEGAGWRWDPAVGGDGLLLDVGSHGLDLLDHWFGPIVEAHGFASSRLPWSSVADEVVGAFRFASGVQGVGTWGFAGATRRDRITVVGTQGRIVVPLFADGPVALTDAGGATVEHAIAQPAHVQEPLIALIVAELLGRGGPCPSTGASALRTQAVLDELLAGRRPTG